MARLPFRKEVAGASQIEIAFADVEASAGPAKFFEDGQPLFGVFRCGLGQEIRECADSPASHTAPELVELGQTELLRPADHNGVRPWNVEAAFHNVGCEKNVRFAVDKAHHPVTELAGGNPAVKADDAKIRSDRLDPRQHWLQILDPRADQEALSATPLLPQQSRGDGSIR